MKTVKTTAQRTWLPAPDLDIDPKSAADAYAELSKRGYDVPGIFRYACAARSWTEKDSAQRQLWKAVEAMCNAVLKPKEVDSAAG